MAAGARLLQRQLGKTALLPAQERRLNQIPDDQLEVRLGPRFEQRPFARRTGATMEWISTRRLEWSL
jgi:hypothetical protein